MIRYTITLIGLKLFTLKELLSKMPDVLSRRIALQVDNVLLPKQKYRQALYKCDRGYVVSSRTSNSLFCQEYSWTGLEVKSFLFYATPFS